MALSAPDTTKWGSVVVESGNINHAGRIGIYTEVTTSATTVTVKLQTWFWSKYSVSDTNNSYYYNVGATSATKLIGSVNINHTVATGTGWSTKNQTKLGESTYTYTRGTSATTISYAAKLTGIEAVGGNAMAVSTSVTIPALAKYTVAYNANGGSGAPSSQTKWYGKSLTLSSTKPTRTGYTFQGWGTSASTSTVSYKSGATYSANAGITLYAVWKANTYTVVYNANGGSGAPSSQTKTYGKTLTLSASVPTRDKYNFEGWSTSASSTVISYNPGDSYTPNSAITLYAVWSVAYIEPRLTNFTVSRCDSSGNALDDGSNALVKCDWECDEDVVSITIDWRAAGDSAWSDPVSVTAGGTSGSVSQIVGSDSLSAEYTYDIRITVSDSSGSEDLIKTLVSQKFTIDFLAGGTGAAFGKTAELGADDSLGGNGVVDFNFDAKFNEPVYGNVVGMNRLPAIPENANLDEYMTTGCWAIQSNAIAATIACGDILLGTDSSVPPAKAGRFEVWSSTGEGIRSEQWSYLRQRFIPYNSNNAVWERDIARGSDNVWHYYDWWKSSLTPNAAAKVYHEQKVLWSGGQYMTASQTAPLSELVSEQANGIVLVFSRYSSNTAQNYHFNTFFIPKEQVSMLEGYGHTFVMTTDGSFSVMATKYLYIHDDHIAGNDVNSSSGTGSCGITYNNAGFVLRYVIGV